MANRDTIALALQEAKCKYLLFMTSAYPQAWYKLFAPGLLQSRYDQRIWRETRSYFTEVNTFTFVREIPYGRYSILIYSLPENS